MRALSASWALGVFGISLWAARGEYQPWAIVVSFAFFAFASLSYMLRTPGLPTIRSAERTLTVLFCLFFVVVMINPMLRAFSDHLATSYMQGFLLLAALGFGVFQFNRTQSMGYWVTLFALAEAQLMVVLVDPSPGIDIWVFYRQGCLHFLAGQNPYTQLYPDIYHGQYPYPPGLHYLPAVLYCLAPFQALFGEIRVGMWVAQLGSALLLGLLARQLGLSVRLQQSAVLVWLIFPSTFEVLEECWIDTLVGFWVLAALLFWLRDRPGLAAGCFGVALCTKQTVVLIGFVTLVFFLMNPNFRRAGLRSLGQASLFALLMMLPYVAANGSVFWTSVTEFWSEPIRQDGFTLVALAINAYDFKIQFWHTLIAYMVLPPLVAWRLARSSSWQDWAGGVVTLLGGIFYFGKQAFLNYYVLLSLLLFAYWLLSLAPGLAHEAPMREHEDHQAEQQSAGKGHGTK